MTQESGYDVAISMKTSIMVITYNEESSIGRCLDAVTNQSVSPDEIVLIAHNCIDRTVEIASRYPQVRTVVYSGPRGIQYARAKGFEEATGDIVFCTDGDSVVDHTWFETLREPFLKDPTIVGSSSNVRYVGNFILSLALWKYILVDQTIAFLTNKFNSKHLVGPSMAIKKSVFEKVGGYSNYDEIHKKAGLSRCAEDAYISILLSREGPFAFNRKILVAAEAKEKTWKEGWDRIVANREILGKLYTYFGLK